MTRPVALSLAELGSASRFLAWAKQRVLPKALMRGVALLLTSRVNRAAELRAVAELVSREAALA